MNQRWRPGAGIPRGRRKGRIICLWEGIPERRFGNERVIRHCPRWLERKGHEKQAIRMDVLKTREILSVVVSD